LACSVGVGGGAGKASFNDFSFVKNVDSATPQLMLACAEGKHINEGLITVRKAGEKHVEYLKIKLTDVLVSSSQSGGAGGIQPQEQVTLNFAKFEISEGGQTTSFDICQNKIE